MDESKNGKYFDADAPESLQAQGTGFKPHWSLRPAGLLIAILVARLLIYLVMISISIPLGLINYSADSEYDLSLLLSFMSIAASLALGELFYWLIVRLQRKHGTAGAASWKTGATFWAGIALVLVYFMLYGVQYKGYLNSPAVAALTIIDVLANALIEALFLFLLFPVMEQKYGIVKSSLIISAAYALPAVLLILEVRLINLLVFNAGAAGYHADSLWGGMASDIISAIFTAFALTALRASLYLIASRRMSSTWILFT